VPRAGEQLSSLTVTNRVLEPEEFKNIELGAKWDITPDLAASAALYQLERRNVSVVNPRFPEQAFLADGQTTDGVELSLSGKLTRAWSVMGGYAYQDAKLAQNKDVPALNGATLAMVPEHSASLWNRYEINPQWAAAVGVSYRGAIFAAVDNKVALPSYTRVDAAVYYKLNNNYQLQINVENLLDKQYYASAHNNNNITPGSPRAVRLTVNAKF
jgi:catecholate siderophore receptor